MKYKAKLDVTMKREITFESNKTKVYSLIWESCMLLMQEQIEQRNDFKKRIYNDPINLTAVIKEQTLNLQDTKYEIEIINNLLTRFLLPK